MTFKKRDQRLQGTTQREMCNFRGFREEVLKASAMSYQEISCNIAATEEESQGI